MKIIEFKLRIMKIMKILGSIRDSLNYENHKFSYENHAIYENRRIPYEKHENHENHSIPMRINTILKIIEFYTRITKSLKSLNSNKQLRKL